MRKPKAATDADASTDRFEALFRRHHAAVVGYVRRRAPGEAVDDVVGETFLVAWPASIPRRQVLILAADRTAHLHYYSAATVHPGVRTNALAHARALVKQARRHEPGAEGPLGDGLVEVTRNGG